jgi:hypothetical protein
VEKAKVKEIRFRKEMEMDVVSINTIIAPSPAPAEIPSIPVSARLFLKNVCKIKPDTDNEIPTRNALSNLGSLISRIIFLNVLFSFEKTFIISIIDILIFPMHNDIIIAKISSIKKISNIKYFFLKTTLFFL